MFLHFYSNRSGEIKTIIMKKLIHLLLLIGSCYAFSYASDTISIQNIDFTLHYPTANSNADNIRFQPVQGKLQKRLNNYPFYKLDKKDWEVGQLFQLLVNTTPETVDQLDDKFIVFSVDAKGVSNLHYPLDDYFSKSIEGKIVVPGLHSAIAIAHQGTEQLCVLYAPNGFDNIETLLSKISQQVAGDIDERLKKAVGEKLAPLSSLNYQKEQFAFSNTDTTGAIVPLFIEIETGSTANIPEEKPNLHLISIGAGNVDLQFTQKDATDFNAIISSQQEVLYDTVFQHLVVGEEATKDTITNMVYQLVEQYKKGEIQKEDVVMIYVSSMGYMKDDELFIQLRNPYTTNTEKTDLPYTDLHRLLEQLPCPKVLFFDASASGVTDTNPPKIYHQLDPIRPLFMDQFITFLSNRKGEYSYEHKDWENGAFTEAILEGFSSKADKNNDGFVMMSELYMYVSERTTAITKEVFNESQQPVMANKAFQDFVVFKY